MTLSTGGAVDAALHKNGARWMLVVEDDDILREGLLDFIEQEGILVVGAANGRAALDHLRQAPSRPQLILLDLVLPVMDGRELMNELERDDLLKAIPLVVISAHLSRYPQSTDGSLSVRVLPKPIDVDALRQIILQCGGTTTYE